jgi:hypothetical protein
MAAVASGIFVSFEPFIVRFFARMNIQSVRSFRLAIEPSYHLLKMVFEKYMYFPIVNVVLFVPGIMGLPFQGFVGVCRKGSQFR